MNGSVTGNLCGSFAFRFADASAGRDMGCNREGMMAEAKSPQEGKPSNAKKDRDDWTTGDEPMTGAQASYLKTLCEEAGEAGSFDPKLSKAEASKRIPQMRQRIGRG